MLTSRSGPAKASAELKVDEGCHVFGAEGLGDHERHREHRRLRDHVQAREDREHHARHARRQVLRPDLDRDRE
jgi:hypothetical protein